MRAEIKRELEVTVEKYNERVLYNRMKREIAELSKISREINHELEMNAKRYQEMEKELRDIKIMGLREKISSHPQYENIKDYFDLEMFLSGCFKPKPLLYRQEGYIKQ